MIRDDYEMVIGLEVHCELSTKTKIFCSCPTEFGGEPNTHCCPVCMAMPGTLPVLNEKVVEYAVKAGLATNCSISQNSKNDRKNYFYPDLPKAYQISQYDKPLCNHGHVSIETPEGEKDIRILRIHIEEDAGKLNHDEYGRGSFVDLNRAGVPLIEIVSEPDMRSAEEAESYMRKLKSILEYIEVSDCKMQEGSLRADVNVSVRKKGSTEFGTRTEMKNMNSFRSIVRGINYEAERQIELIENGEAVTQETLRWDDISGRTFSMRDKEDAQDYRYFPDPDLVAIKLSDEYIENIKKALPELPESRKKRYMEEMDLSEKAANFVTSSKYYSNIFDEATEKCNNPKAVSNWLMSDIAKVLNEREEEADKIPFSGKELGELIELIDKGTISNSIGKKVLNELFENPKAPSKIIEEKGWVQISDEGAIKEVVIKVLENNPQSVADYKAGKDKALGFLVGQAMKETRGKANPQMLNKMFIEELKK
ncbi:MAG: Asp-tRNA(Asn)/Glu-tRNA(Gln) amidotransferase subunit GatB [Clostridia bacterium]|nr:Asp-tRNA(Asn)/Glu-tRNA(Gln) amidotransferase subunit GatB [Clostridia bacterium]MBR3152180.1 Asp-tRNA(Asn)/Glu-tRNA(Gln) amidotransferase subunit GatB [Clostridia bacterium]MBR3152283.1 Asp-tRNA(Asn)/Glu-tRNA(Gln) amidotransferase subunit GatB [Clostridia bacterium]